MIIVLQLSVEQRGTSELSDILLRNDFWRTVVLGGFSIVLVSVSSVLSTEAPYVLAITAILDFIAWMHRAHDASAETAEDESDIDAIEALGARYANGDIDETEFEHRLDTLLETEATKPREK